MSFRLLLQRFLWVLVACMGLLVIFSLSPRVARADEKGAADDGVASFVGRQDNGMIGTGRVAFASDMPLHLTGALGAGYGYTEPLQVRLLSGNRQTDAGPHHRAAGSAAFAIQPLRFLSAALMFQGRLDQHPNDVLGASSTGVGEPRLFVRAAQALGSSFALGADVGVWVPGAEAPSFKAEAATVDAKVLATVVPMKDLAIALNAGYRLDRSAETLEPGQQRRLRSGDRLSLALSDFDAVLLGLGASKRFGQAEVIGDVSWDVLLGANAPPATTSPLRVGAGGRYHIDVGRSDLQVELRGEVGLSSRAPDGPADPLVPTEPRVAVLAGLRWVLPLASKAPIHKQDNVDDKTTTPMPSGPATTIEGKVTSESGEAIAGAKVSTDPEHSAETGPDGTYRLGDVPPGPARVSVKATGFDDTIVEVTVEAQQRASANVSMKRTIKPGSLRGLVRSFNGKPLAATIRVEPIGVETKTDADGTFQIDVPPGSYEVVINAPGHANQKRPVQVEENGVTVLNADLRPGP